MISFNLREIGISLCVSNSRAPGAVIRSVAIMAVVKRDEKKELSILLAFQGPIKGLKSPGTQRQADQGGRRSGTQTTLS